MGLTLNPEVEHRLERRLLEGRWKTVSEVVETALDLLDDMDDLIVVSRQELDGKLDESFAAAERGDTISGKDLEAELDAWRAKLGACVPTYDPGETRPGRHSELSGARGRRKNSPSH